MIFSVSLSRAHKIGERLKSRVSELTGLARTAGSPQHVQLRGGQQVATALQNNGDLAVAYLSGAVAYSAALTSLRIAISNENHKRGISDLMARLEEVNRRMAARKSVLTHCAGSATALTINDFRETVAAATAPTSNDYGSGYEVKMVSAFQMDQLTKEIAADNRESFALSDKIAELNAAPVSIEMDDEIAKEVTGA